VAEPPAAEPPASPPTPGEPVEGSSVFRKPGVQLALKIGSGAVAAIGLVTGVIGVWPILFGNGTSFDTFSSSAKPYPSSVVSYAVNRAAPFETFPAGTGSRCDEAQQSWLAAHGTVVVEEYLVDLTNTANSGALLTLQEVIGSGDVTPSDDSVVRVLCNTTGAPESSLAAAHLDPSSGVPAAFASSAQGSGSRPDTPVVYTLEPGETGQIVIRLQSSAAFTGDVVATLVHGGERRVVTIIADELSAIGWGSAWGSYLAIADGVLVCHAPNGACPATGVPMAQPAEG
jgi:hypothetical protein